MATAGRRLALAAALGLGLALLGGASPALADGSFTLVGHDDLGARGLNAGLALADHCAYVGSRGQGPIEIVDITSPANLKTLGTVGGRSLTTARELRAVPSKKLLIVLSYQLGRGGVNRLDFYQWGDDCAQLNAVGNYDFGGRPPHEMYLWQDASRTLVFTTMFSGAANDLQVVDASDPAHPRLAGTWSPPVGLLHSISLSADGKRAYLSLWTGGMLVADASQFTTGAANPQLTVLTPVANRLRPLAGGNIHSAVQVPGKDLLIVTDERYPPNCPYGPARLVDISDPASPRAVSTLSAPENDPATCRNSPEGTYTSHNPTILGNLALITWYSSGIQAFDIADPANPVREAEYRPNGSDPGARSPELGVTTTMTWTYPIIRDGLIYIADINEGLYVLSYTGPEQGAVSQVAFAEGNSNLFALKPAPTPTPTATPARPSPVSSVPAVPARPVGSNRTLLVGTLVALVVVALGAGLALRNRLR